jgi:5-methylcytosine-specific restriction protein B
MTYADDVRAYCAEQMIEPARSKGVTEVAIRAGDVHRAMGYKNRLPLVCSALGAAVFEQTARVKRTAVEGPLASTTTVIRFTVLP